MLRSTWKGTCCDQPVPNVVANHKHMHTKPWARTQALSGRGKREPGIHCLRMRLISHKSWEIGNYCVISYNRDDKTYTYRYIVHTFSDQRWKRFDCSFSWALQLPPAARGTSDMSLNKVQVATSLDFCWENTCLYGYCLVSLCDTTVLPFVMDCKLAKTSSE